MRELESVVQNVSPVPQNNRSPRGHERVHEARANRNLLAQKTAMTGNTFSQAVTSDDLDFIDPDSIDKVLEEYDSELNSILDDEIPLSSISSGDKITLSPEILDKLAAKRKTDLISACPNCGSSVLSTWKHCPKCNAKL